MKLYPHRTPSIIKSLFPKLIWDIPSGGQVIYLTFDDGPQEHLTKYILDQLAGFNAKASFFVIGENIKKYENQLDLILADGHVVGNHTQHHFDGWKTSLDKYIQDVDDCQDLLIQRGVDTRLYRPPYGRMTTNQIRRLVNYRIVMWDWLTGDFDLQLNLVKAKKRLSGVTSGSIVVFHDNNRFEHNLKELLPWFLQEFASRGYNFEAIPQHYTQ